MLSTYGFRVLCQIPGCSNDLSKLATSFSLAKNHFRQSGWLISDDPTSPIGVVCPSCASHLRLFPHLNLRATKVLILLQILRELTLLGEQPTTIDQFDALLREQGLKILEFSATELSGDPDVG